MKKNKKLLQALRILNSFGGENNLPHEFYSFNEYRPKKSVIIYRGLSFNSTQDYLEKMRTEFNPKKGAYLSGFFGIHWTTSLETAEEFAQNAGTKIRVILMAEVEPDRILLEMDRLPQEILDELEWTNEEEVIVLNGSIDITIIDCWESVD
jgi:hypothetical protein